MRSAKCPIVLTANTASSDLVGLNCCHHRVLSRPSPQELALLLAMIWTAENLPPLPLSILSKLATMAHGDIRSALLELQLWCPTLLKLLPPGSDSPVVVDVTSPGVQEEVQQEEEEELACEAQEEGQVVPFRTPMVDNLLGYKLPQVRSVWPYSGLPEGGSRIRVQGNHFLQDQQHGAGPAVVELLLGHTPCTNVRVVSDEEIVGTTPPVPSNRFHSLMHLPVRVRICRLITSDRTPAATFAYKTKSVMGICSYLVPKPPVVPRVTKTGSGKKRRFHRARRLASTGNDCEEEDEEELEEPGVPQPEAGSASTSEEEADLGDDDYLAERGEQEQGEHREEEDEQQQVVRRPLGRGRKRLRLAASDDDSDQEEVGEEEAGPVDQGMGVTSESDAQPTPPKCVEEEGHHGTVEMCINEASPSEVKEYLPTPMKHMDDVNGQEEEVVKESPISTTPTMPQDTSTPSPSGVQGKG